MTRNTLQSVVYCSVPYRAGTVGLAGASEPDTAHLAPSSKKLTYPAVPYCNDANVNAL